MRIVAYLEIRGTDLPIDHLTSLYEHWLLSSAILFSDFRATFPTVPRGSSYADFVFCLYGANPVLLNDVEVRKRKKESWGHAL